MQYRIVCSSTRGGFASYRELHCSNLAAAMAFAAEMLVEYDSVGIYHGPQCIVVFGDDDTLAVSR